MLNISVAALGLSESPAKYKQDEIYQNLAGGRSFITKSISYQKIPNWII